MSDPGGIAPWLRVVGIGEDGLDGLGRVARSLVDTAGCLVGGERHLALVPPDGRERLTWPTPFAPLADALAARRGQSVCVLASGDPLCHGVGSVLLRHFPIEEMTIVPAPAAFSLARARLGWSAAEVTTVTVHGRPVTSVALHLHPGARLLVLAEGAGTPRAVAALLATRGYHDSRFTVLECLGGPRERIRTMTPAAAPDDADPLHVLAIECVPDPGIALLPRVPGLPDDAFRHDGQLTKREVRAVTLAGLAPVPGQHLWDLGAGCGSIAIEWLRAARGATATAVERNAARIGFIADNAAALGVPQLDIIHAEHGGALDGLSPPDAIFVGGGLRDPDLLARCQAALRPGGRLVANVVSIEGERLILAHRARFGGDVVRLAVSYLEPIGPLQAFRNSMTVTQYRGGRSIAGADPASPTEPDPR